MHTHFPGLGAFPRPNSTPVSQEPAEPPVVRRGPAGALHVLIVEDDASVRQVCAEMAGSYGCEVTTADSVPAASLLITQRPLDVVFLDLKLPGGSGASLLQQLREHQPRALVVVMTAYATVSSAVELMRNGVCDLLQKPFNLEQISAVLERARQQRQWSAPSRALHDRLTAGGGAGRFIGASAAIEKVFRIVSKVALTRHPVLIQGETGTGKEIIARMIHGGGAEPASPFIPVDCDSLAPESLEGELFGEAEDVSPRHRSRQGALLSARQGTVYLDEVGALPAPLQLKLLRALQDKQTVPVGGGAGVRFESRILASSCKDLEALVETGRFRKDLFYRLNVVNLRIPPLRERVGDVPLLAAHFLERQRRELDTPFAFSEEALQWLDDNQWAGNVRELENVIERACALSSGPLLHLGDLSTQLQAYAHAVAAQPTVEQNTAETKVVETIEETERRTIRHALQTFQGDKLMAAKALGIGKTTLYRKLKEYGMGDEAA